MVEQLIPVGQTVRVAVSVTDTGGRASGSRTYSIVAMLYTGSYPPSEADILYGNTTPVHVTLTPGQTQTVNVDMSQPLQSAHLGWILGILVIVMEVKDEQNPYCPPTSGGTICQGSEDCVQIDATTWFCQPYDIKNSDADGLDTVRVT